MRARIAEHVDEERFSRVIKEISGIRFRHPESLKAELLKDFASCGVTFRFGRVAYPEKTAAPLIEWIDGKVLYHGEDGSTMEILYVHFMATKHWWHWLFWSDDSPSNSRHYFSRVGYGANVCDGVTEI